MEQRRVWFGQHQQQPGFAEFAGILWKFPKWRQFDHASFEQWHNNPRQLEQPARKFQHSGIEFDSRFQLQVQLQRNSIIKFGVSKAAFLKREPLFLFLGRKISGEIQGGREGGCFFENPGFSVILPHAWAG